MKILVVVQARCSSTRLHAKVLLEAAGETLLLHQLRRISRATLPWKTIIATTTDRIDDAIVNLCNIHNYEVFRGHPIDLLDRHYQAALAFGADIVVKIPSDCPLIDPKVIDRVLQFYNDNQNTYDYVSNLHPATYPDGNDVEILPLTVLHDAWVNASKPFEREHTTPYIWDNPNQFTIGNVECPDGINYSMSHRWTLDYQEDYEFIRSVYEHLYPQNPNFSMKDILDLLALHPEIAAINTHLAGVNWYRHHLKELQTVSSQATKNFINSSSLVYQQQD
ncbi:MAG: glycosyltransferase family protein [Ignavibacteria bacterium]|nr:glycosyltransferase family protein [Ignavibacteria bacterium]